jgi:hypothetical protein
MSEALDNIGRWFGSLPEKIMQGFQYFLAWLMDLAAGLFAWLPDHTPLALPDVSGVFQIMAIFGTYARWVHWPVVLGVFGLIIGYKLAVLLYAAYRAVLGLVPMLK